MIKRLRDVWQQLRWYPQGCSFEDDYRFIQEVTRHGAHIGKP